MAAAHLRSRADRHRWLTSRLGDRASAETRSRGPSSAELSHAVPSLLRSRISGLLQIWCPRQSRKGAVLCHAGVRKRNLKICSSSSTRPCAVSETHILRCLSAPFLTRIMVDSRVRRTACPDGCGTASARRRSPSATQNTVAATIATADSASQHCFLMDLSTEKFVCDQWMCM